MEHMLIGHHFVDPNLALLLLVHYVLFSERIVCLNLVVVTIALESILNTGLLFELVLVKVIRRRLVLDRGLDTVRHRRCSNVARLVLKLPVSEEPLAVHGSDLDRLLMVKC
jgi:hypothetical protein